MAFSLVLIDGFYRRVTERRAVTGGSSVQVIVGFREMNSTSAKSPGPGWQARVGKQRSWTKREPRIEERFVNDKDVLECEDWPTGVAKHSFNVEWYDAILAPSIAAGVTALGAIGKRQPPEVNIAVLEAQIKEAGLVMPTADEFKSMVKAIWTRDNRPASRLPTAGSADVIGRRPTAKPESAKPESAKPESAKPESAKPESAKPESTVAES